MVKPCLFLINTVLGNKKTERLTKERWTNIHTEDKASSEEMVKSAIRITIKKTDFRNTQSQTYIPHAYSSLPRGQHVIVSRRRASHCRLIPLPEKLKVGQTTLSPYGKDNQWNNIFFKTISYKRGVLQQHDLTQTRIG